jgi:hypothetical protein
MKGLRRVKATAVSVEELPGFSFKAVPFLLDLPSGTFVEFIGRA